MIDKTAIIDPSAKIADSVHVGPYSVIGPDVEIGEGTWIGPHVVIQGPTRIGRDNKIFQFASVGEVTQDKKFRGEKTYLEIGDGNVIREFCTLNRGTSQESMTKIGDHNLFMAYVHIAHDCEVGNHTIFANNASLAGHVKVEDHAILSGFSGVFQFCRVGAYSFAATNSVIIKDVPPYVKVSGYYAKPFGLNTVGLQRHGFTEASLKQLRRAYKVIYRNGLTVAKAIEELKKMECPEVQRLIDFIQTSQAGIVR
ncbi:acyl-ACP--UDP-N-acetylglucosamine O-acyltransferase [Aquicella lusitana]|uniref:Acyl-[acyl-carrier-protein]--UDP-N-acetylglucosamine O-acyltransferase n=1 Tax=Aquicella lusitana TaxID=254246 RepID=A0A370GF29_9COXI|nr:acyl-ACP--UDP-N-acetylglucosamine O-acyltransferase [Aquicella lusitana]RDI41796.1 acyl-[acyl-carrier-protein]--UDP-N-acetylglucosamine O-acyltransferase [Aquicella lusitana]VVC73705.1 Acyl-[acyl-carrier-protein]--UDP-N-acetylglucosamine O-acyltransferase [Aquicella lusitana]